MNGFYPGFTAMDLRELIYIVAVVIVGFILLRSRGRFLTGTTLVLRKFHFSDDPSAKTVLEISGRPAGIIGFLLTLLRLDPDYELTVTDSAVSIRATSLSGLFHYYVPLRSVASTGCGYQRSILALAFAILFSAGFVYNFLTGVFENNRNNVSGDMSAAFLFLVLAAIAALIYYLSKKIGISVETTGGNQRGLVFKRSVIENLSVDLPQALRAVAAVNGRVLAAPCLPAAMGGPEPPASPSSGPVRCPQCSASNPPGTRYCENCGSALS